ncbi:unnamed protein product [Alternaria alternata]
MNVSQLAVYQLPDEVHTMQKRTTVPFYNRRRALEQRETPVISDTTATPTQSSSPSWFNRLNKWTYSTTAGPPLSCMTTFAAASIADPASSASDCTCGKDPVDDPIFQRPNGQVYVSPTSVLTPASFSTQDTSPVFQRPNGQPYDIPTPLPSSMVKRQAADWSRIAYYTSTAPAQATGLSFMANLGDPQNAFGNSLSYVTPRGDKVAAESLPFNGMLQTSETEIVVLSDKECDADCPYWRPNATSHYGWSGSSKAFFIEFQMDHYANLGTDQGMLSDAPAYWFLNAAIPRILQYGNDRNNIPCSCWSTGCGEFDAFELLSSGAERAKSTIHRQGNLEGGDSNYFSRPVGQTMKFAVVWHYPHITALVLDDKFDFSQSMSDDAMKKLVAYDPDSWVHSLYAIGD